MNAKGFILLAIAGLVVMASGRAEVTSGTPPLVDNFGPLEDLVSSADLGDDDLAEIYQALVTLERTINELG